MSVYSDECLGCVVIVSIAESDLKFVSRAAGKCHA